MWCSCCMIASPLAASAHHLTCIAGCFWQVQPLCACMAQRGYKQPQNHVGKCGLRSCLSGQVRLCVSCRPAAALHCEASSGLWCGSLPQHGPGAQHQRPAAAAGPATHTCFGAGVCQPWWPAIQGVRHGRPGAQHTMQDAPLGLTQGNSVLALACRFVSCQQAVGTDMTDGLCCGMRGACCGCLCGPIEWGHRWHLLASRQLKKLWGCSTGGGGRISFKHRQDQQRQWNPCQSALLYQQ